MALSSKNMNRLCWPILLWLLIVGVADAQQLAFPTAEGFGRFAQGGRGGTVMKVTNLNTSGAGSLQACLIASGPRTCIFDVSGIIEYPCCGQTQITNPFLTVAGQTAPGEVIVKGQEILVRTHDVIIRHLQVRTGGGGGSTGALEMFEARNVMIDHCSLSWATDDTMGTYKSDNITFQWCIIAEGLNSVSYGKGGITRFWTGGVGSGQGASLLHNLYAHFVDRVPYHQGGNLQMVNNVIYNVRQNLNNAPIFGTSHIELRANHWLRGPGSVGTFGTSVRNLGPGWSGCGWLNASYSLDTKVYLDGEFHSTLRPTDTGAEDSHVQQGGATCASLNPTGPGWPTTATPFGDFPAIASQTDAVTAKTDVLAGAGVRVPLLSSVDSRIINEVNTLTGEEAPSSPGTYPTIDSESRSGGYDTDGDGMPDTWETARGLNENSASDGPQISSNGYTHLENFLNETAGDTIPGNPYEVIPPPSLYPARLRGTLGGSATLR